MHWWTFAIELNFQMIALILFLHLICLGAALGNMWWLNYTDINPIYVKFSHHSLYTNTRLGNSLKQLDTIRSLSIFINVCLRHTIMETLTTNSYQTVTLTIQRCAHQPEWNASVSTITFQGWTNFLISQNGEKRILLGEEDSGPINPHTGQFTAQDQGSATISIILFLYYLHPLFYSGKKLSFHWINSFMNL